MVGGCGVVDGIELADVLGNQLFRITYIELVSGSEIIWLQLCKLFKFFELYSSLVFTALS